jgi:hypothetical protein
VVVVEDEVDEGADVTRVVAEREAEALATIGDATGTMMMPNRPSRKATTWHARSNSIHVLIGRTWENTTGCDKRHRTKVVTIYRIRNTMIVGLSTYGQVGTLERLFCKSLPLQVVLMLIYIRRVLFHLCLYL